MQEVKSRIERMKMKFAEHYVWGIRFDVAGLPVGHQFPASRVWANDEPTDEILDGTSCIQDTHLNAITATNFYVGTPYIVCGEHAGYGADRGEVLIRDCEVMALVEDQD